MKKITNTFLNSEDYSRVEFVSLRKQFEYVYSDLLHGKPSYYGAKPNSKTKIHTSRDWEYPWAILNSEVKQGDRVLDCGCGGSPLLPFLALHGCDCYGIDPNIFMNRSLINHYNQSIKNIIKRYNTLKSENAGKITIIKQVLSRIARSIRRPNNLWGFKNDPNKKLGTTIKYSTDSLEKINYPDGFFDKVYCISVIEHLSEPAAIRGTTEMARVLKKGGLLIITMDDSGEHVTPQLKGNFRKIISASGLKLYGNSDFIKPENTVINYAVVGFILKK